LATVPTAAAPCQKPVSFQWRAVPSLVSRLNARAQPPLAMSIRQYTW
jgi:hypothetical protein